MLLRVAEALLPLPLPGCAKPTGQGALSSGFRCSAGEMGEPGCAAWDPDAAAGCALTEAAANGETDEAAAAAAVLSAVGVPTGLHPKTEELPAGEQEEVRRLGTKRTPECGLRCFGDVRVGVEAAQLASVLERLSGRGSLGLPLCALDRLLGPSLLRPPLVVLMVPLIALKLLLAWLTICRKAGCGQHS